VSIELRFDTPTSLQQLIRETVDFHDGTLDLGLIEKSAMPPDRIGYDVPHIFVR